METTEAIPDGLLDRVRALLAKAEATTFESEAEAFTAKAQELMARHRIERALLDAQSPSASEHPGGRRIGVPDPYAAAKAILLSRIAVANGCTAVWQQHLGYTTVFGFGAELEAVDTLFASLLIQATGALRRHGSKYDELGRSRTKRFRRSFLVAFAVRIGERLQESVDNTVHDVSVSTGAALVPILADRAEASRDAARAAFPKTRTFNPSATDGEGWHAGKAFADEADLGIGPRLTRRSA